MPEVSTITVDFSNAGLVQKIDPSLLSEGQYYTLENMHSLQEGALSVRRGAARKCQIPGSLVHTIIPFRVGNDTYLYIGEGQGIYRVKVGEWSPQLVANYVSQWGRGWSAAPYFAGESGRPYIFIAAGEAMLKDTGQLGTLQKWGIDPPTSAAQASVQESTPVYVISTPLSVVTPEKGFWAVDQRSVNVDLSEGGDTSRGYDSKDPIKVTLNLSQANAASEIRVFLSVGDDTFVNRYEKPIVISSLASYLSQQETAKEAAEQISRHIDMGIWPPYNMPEFGQPVVPVEMPPAEPSAQLQDVISIPKNEWMKVGKAGQQGYDWRSVRAVMIQVRSNVQGLTVSVGPIALYGRYGPSNTGVSDTEYKWVYTYRNSSTKHESAPSPIMPVGVISDREKVVVSVIGSNDPQVDKVAVYRSGGAFTDSYYRLVGEINNAPGTLYFEDIKSDPDIATAPVAEFDNFPPPNGEVCLHAFDSLFIGGIKDYPHVLVRSKTGRPESFPIVNEATGAYHRVNVGSPSDGIMALVEFQGAVVSLNLNSIYVIGMWMGELKEPIRTPAHRGLIARHGFTVAENEIWFLSYDGVYSWAGGDAKLRSSAIDWMFKGETVNGIHPIDMSENGLRLVSMAYHRNAVWMTCRNTAGQDILLMCDPSGGMDRWHVFKASGEGGASSITCLAEDRASGILYSARSLTSGGTSAYIYQEDIGKSDNGHPIPFKARTGWYNMKADRGMISDFALDVECSSPFVVRLYTDYNSSPVAQFTVPQTTVRSMVPLPVVNESSVPEGKEVSAFSVEVEGTSSGTVNIHSLSMSVARLVDLQKGRTEDWDNLGYLYDKRLDQITIQYDSKGGQITVYLDVLKGIQGNEQELAAAEFTLTGAGRGHATFQILGRNGLPLVAKMVRVRYSSSSPYMIYGREITYERYPPDIVRFTEPSDWGSPYRKYFQQLILDVDTGGTNASVSVWVDGQQKQALTVNTTQFDRKRTLTLNPGIVGRLGWIQVSPAQNGKFQLFSHEFIVAPADKGPVVHTFDWDDLGHPYDKLLFSLSVEYEVSAQTEINLKAIVGITGNQQEVQLMQIPLKTGGRYRESFSFPPDTVVKMIRMQPTSTNVEFRAWGYAFDFERYPADVVRSTEPSDWGTPYEKYFQQLVLDVDTGGVTASVSVVIDGQVVQSLSVSTTASDRNRTLTLLPELKGRKGWIRATPGTGGKFQLFMHHFIVSPADKGPVVHTFDWDDLGHPYDKVLKSVSLEYEVTADTWIHIDVLAGPAGEQTHNRLMSIPLKSGGRRRESFPMPIDTVAKMVRLYPALTNVQFKAWKYKFESINLPPDVVTESEWDYAEWPYEKILRDIVVEADTASSVVQVALDVDGRQAFEFQVSSTFTDRVRIVTVPSDIVGKMFRIRALGSPRKFSLYSVRYNVIPEPPAIHHWDSYEINCGFDGVGIIRRMSLDYQSTGPINVKVYTEKGILVDAWLPAHSARTPEMVLFPSSRGHVVNRVRVFRVVISCREDHTFKFYREASWIELMPQTSRQRESYSRLGFGAWKAVQA